MKTLIELFDDRPIENVLASEVFMPDRTIFLCPSEIFRNMKIKTGLQDYFRHKGLKTKLVFMESAMYSSERLARQISSITEQYTDCVVDITGGTDAALFACGTVCQDLGIPVFTYSRRQNRFYNIFNAEFADQLPCEVNHSVEDCFLMAGGALRMGRVDNSVLSDYSEYFDPFFEVYMNHRSEWLRTVNYIQKASQHEKDAPIRLEVSAGHFVKGDRGNRVEVPENVMRELERIGFIKDLDITHDQVRFTFKDSQVRSWLRDIGSVLELYIYKAFLDSGLFNDVITSAIVDWEGELKQNDVTNEIDVMAMHGVLPVFVSCKTCDVETEALNELAILRDRFGGKGARAAIVSTQRCRSITRHRAAELDIDVIDLEDIKRGDISERIKALTHVRKD